MHSFLLLTRLAVTSISVGERACFHPSVLCSPSHDQVTLVEEHGSPSFYDLSTRRPFFGSQDFDTVMEFDGDVLSPSAQTLVLPKPEISRWGPHLSQSPSTIFDAGPLYEWPWRTGTWKDENGYDIMILGCVKAGSVDAKELEADYSKAGKTRFEYTMLVSGRVPAASRHFKKMRPRLQDAFYGPQPNLWVRPSSRDNHPSQCGNEVKKQPNLAPLDSVNAGPGITSIDMPSSNSRGTVMKHATAATAEGNVPGKGFNGTGEVPGQPMLALFVALVVVLAFDAGF